MVKLEDLLLGFGHRLFSIFKNGAVAIVSRVLGAYGLTLVSMNTVMPPLKAALIEKANMLPAHVLQFASAIGLDVFFTMILSGLAIGMAGRVMVMPTSIANQLPGQTP